MSDYRQDPPPDELIEALFYKDGLLCWKDTGNEVGHTDRLGYRVFCSRKGQVKDRLRSYKVHRVIFYMLTGEWPPIVDHIDRDKQNNYPENLRAVSTTENSMNRTITERNRTGYIGVKKDGKKFSARLRINNKDCIVSGFHDAKHAALFRDLMAHSVYGNIANLNILGK
ncbi:HNH endonuclease, partial [Salmonella enterica]|nr:HNH endonuclease [Salmonella enterica]